MGKTGIAIIGTGAIANVHIDAYKRFDDVCEIRALCDIFKDKAERVKNAKNLFSRKCTRTGAKLLTGRI